MCLRKRSKQTVRGHWCRFPSDDTAALSSSWRSSTPALSHTNTHTLTHTLVYFLSFVDTEPSGKIETKIAPNWSHTTPGGAGGGTCSWASMGGRRGSARSLRRHWFCLPLHRHLIHKQPCGIDFRHWLFLLAKERKMGPPRARNGTENRKENTHGTERTKLKENNKENHLTHFYVLQQLPLTIKLQIQKSVRKIRNAFCTGKLTCTITSAKGCVYLFYIALPLYWAKKSCCNGNYNKQRNIKT